MAPILLRYLSQIAQPIELSWKRPKRAYYQNVGETRRLSYLTHSTYTLVSSSAHNKLLRIAVFIGAEVIFTYVSSISLHLANDSIIFCITVEG